MRVHFFGAGDVGSACCGGLDEGTYMQIWVCGVGRYQKVYRDDSFAIIVETVIDMDDNVQYQCNDCTHESDGFGSN